jgi:hypothetical protein
MYIYLIFLKAQKWYIRLCIQRHVYPFIQKYCFEIANESKLDLATSRSLLIM